MAAGMPRQRWQVNDCPSWCAVVHQDEDAADDRKHVSEARAVSVVELVGTEPRDAEVRVDATSATEMVVCLQRRDGASTTWVYVGDGFDQGIEMSVESWERVVAHVLEALARARDDRTSG